MPIVAAVATASHVANQPGLGAVLNEAVRAAIEKAIAEGISVYDVKTLRARMDAARDQAKEAWLEATE